MIIKVEWAKTRGGTTFYSTNGYDGVKSYEVESQYWVLAWNYSEENENALQVVGSNFDGKKRIPNRGVRCEVDKHFIDFEHVEQFIHGDDTISVKLIIVEFWNGEVKTFASSVANKIFLMNDNGETIDKL